MSRRSIFPVLLAVVVATVALFFGGAGFAQGNRDSAFEHAREIQGRHTPSLMAKPGVVGTAIGLDAQGNHVLTILLEHGRVAGLPSQLEGVTVRPLVTGSIDALKPPADRPDKPGKPPKPEPDPSIDPTARFDRPVPIGVSTGNANSMSAGTIACRVRDSLGKVYTLSNNHVYALENLAGADDDVVQPGRLDGGVMPADFLGTLAGFEPIVFSTTANNRIDAAIAVTSKDVLGTSTPSDGYGIPDSTTVTADLGMAVQKYGRTTALTKGTITGVNAIVNVGYSQGTAQFVDQIIVEARNSFIKPGDSGSLLVTDPGRQPVGLLFAGNRPGKLAIANHIGDVLAALEVTIDGQ